MTCYFRHMNDIFKKIDVEVTQDNEKEIGKKIHEYLGIDYKNCSQTWRIIKERRDETPNKLITELKKVLTK